MFREFEDRVQADLEVALARACERLGSRKHSHEARAFVAERLLVAAKSGNRSLTELTASGVQAASDYLKQR